MKRKRQNSTREAQTEDKASVSKRKKKAKVAEEVQCDEKDHEELKTDIESAKRTVQNMPETKRGRKERVSKETGKILS